MWGWTKLGAHAHSNRSIFKTTTLLFSVNMALINVLPLSLQSALYRTSRFLEGVPTLAAGEPRNKALLFMLYLNFEYTKAVTYIYCGKSSWKVVQQIAEVLQQDT